MTILVTGAAGYIGQNFISRLIKEDTEYLALDTLEISDPFESFVKADIRDLELLVKLFTENEIRSIVHFAAKKSVLESTKNPDEFMQINYEATANLAKIAKDFGVENFFFASSAAVYENSSANRISENSRLSPQNIYGESKLLAERFLQDLFEDSGTRLVIFRFFNVAGAGDDFVPIGFGPNVFPSIIKALLTNSTFRLNGSDFETEDGSCIRDFVHVSDVCDLIFQFIKNSQTSHGVFNVSSGMGCSMFELITLFERVSGLRINVEIGPRRPEDPSKVVGDNRKLLDLFPDIKMSDLESMVSSEWKSYEKFN